MIEYEDTTQDEVAGELGRLIDISDRLRAAMLTRDPDQIMAVVEEQNANPPCTALMTATPDVLEDERVHRLASHLQRLQESNRLVAGAFLKIYRSALQPRKQAKVADPGLYGRFGQSEAPPEGPLFVSQTG